MLWRMALTPDFNLESMSLQNLGYFCINAGGCKVRPVCAFRHPSLWSRRQDGEVSPEVRCQGCLRASLRAALRFNLA